MNLIEKIVTINSVTNLNPADKKPINFKDENGDKYVLWKTKQDGSETVAYSMFKSLPYGGDGQTVGIAYEEAPMTFTNDQGKEISFKQRSIKVMKTPSAVRPANQVPNTKSPVMQKQSERLADEKEKDKWDRISFGKTKHGFLIEIFKQELGNPTMTLLEVEKKAEEWAKMSMRIVGDSGVKTQVSTEEALYNFNKGATANNGIIGGGSIKHEEEISVDQIPF